jgi:hypothetical protein
MPAAVPVLIGLISRIGSDRVGTQQLGGFLKQRARGGWNL